MVKKTKSIDIIRVSVVVISDLSTDMRVFKQVGVLNELGCRVSLTGRFSSQRIMQFDEGIEVKRLKVPFSRGAVMYLWFNTALFFRLLFRPSDIFVSNDLDTLLPCYLAAVIYGGKVVYDSHECFTEQYSLSHRKLRKALWTRLERFLITRVENVITVSPSIARYISEKYGVEALVVRNIPPFPGIITPVDRSILGADSGELLVVYQGAGIHGGRGGEELLEAMRTTEGIRLLIIGGGDAYDTLREMVISYSIEDRVIFLPRMPWRRMLSYTSACDLGISVDQDNCLNHSYSLPNKLFDYIAAGIPVAVTPLAEISSLVENYRIGVVMPGFSSSVISETLMRLNNERALLHNFRANVAVAARELTWEKEKVREQDFFRGVINSKLK